MRCEGRPLIVLSILIALILLSLAHAELSVDLSVDSCLSFLEALKDNTATHVVVSGNARCSKGANWPSKINITRNLTVKGETFGESRLRLPDDTIIVLHSNYIMTFDNLLLFVHTFDDGITLPFMEIERGSEVFVQNTAIISDECEDSKVSNVGRTVRDGDVGVYNVHGEEIAHSCNTVHICDDDGELVTKVAHSLNIQFHRDECSNGSFSLNTSEISSSNSSSIAMITIVTSVIFAVLVVILTAIVVLLLAKRSHGEDYYGKSEIGLPAQRTHLSTVPHFRKLESADRGRLERNETDTRGVMSGDPLTFGNANFKLSDIEIGEHLGRGSFGKVYKGHWQGTDVAVKCIVHGRRILETRDEPFEAYLSRQVSHPNVVQTFIVHTVPVGGAAPTRNEALGESTMSDVQQKDSNNEDIMSTDDVFGSMTKGLGEHEESSLETWIVLEFCDKGALSRTIRDGSLLSMQGRDKKANIIHTILTGLDIARAMMYLHNVRIIHGDLKAENVLLKSDASDPRGFVCKVGDFGLSRFLAEDTHIETFTCGTITHMPPEVLKGGVLTPAADVYSFAILLWELLTGTSPYGKKSHGEIMLIVVNRQKRPSIPDYCPDGYAELLEDCWRQSHLERPGFPEIVDRLKDLLEEETANQMALDAEASTPVAIIGKGNTTSVSRELPSSSSYQPMSCENGWTMAPTNESEEVLFPGDFSLCRSSDSQELEENMVVCDLRLEGRSNPCFMMSTELSTPQEMIDGGSSSSVFTRIIEADESE